ncbi:MAG: radical SAM protein [Thermoplasmatota archaeon]
MYDPLLLSEQLEPDITRGTERKYYRFRATRFYGGIATADVVGCNLRCHFCWSGSTVWHAEKGDFYTPEEVADRLASLAASHGYQRVRLSGGEPTMGRRHLLGLLETLDPSLLFVLETNGILLGVDRRYVDRLSSFSNLHVRLSLKGSTMEEFSLLTGAKPEGHRLQMQALRYLRDSNLSFNIALVTTKKRPDELFDRLVDMGLGSVMLEEETVKLYPPVRKRLRDAGLLDRFE